MREVELLRSMNHVRQRSQADIFGWLSKEMTLEPNVNKVEDIILDEHYLFVFHPLPLSQRSSNELGIATSFWTCSFLSPSSA